MEGGIILEIVDEFITNLTNHFEKHFDYINRGLFCGIGVNAILLTIAGFMLFSSINEENKINNYDSSNSEISFDEMQMMFNYLSEEEIETILNNGKVTASDLNKILDRIRIDYQEQLPQINNSLKLTK